MVDGTLISHVTHTHTLISHVTHTHTDITRDTHTHTDDITGDTHTHTDITLDTHTHTHTHTNSAYAQLTGHSGYAISSAIKRKIGNIANPYTNRNDEEESKYAYA